MGRHILRRTPLVPAGLLLITTAAMANAATIAAESPSMMPGYSVPRQGAAAASQAVSPTYRPPRQTHAAPKSWSVDVAELIDRPEVRSWMERWSSGDGLTKLRVAEERWFPYRREVSAIIRASGIPWEAAAIPIVESNWRVNAVSSSGAAGPWQFLESSARGRNLIIDAWRDDRRDIWRSTDAAMRELAFYDRLFSDWVLAAAAYNAGPTRIRKLRAEGNYENFWDMLDAGVIPPETRDYVPKVIAVSWAIAHAGRLGLPISWDSPGDWVLIEAQRSVPLEKLAEKAGYSTAQAYAAHRELNHPVTPPPSLPYAIKVPASGAATVQEWLRRMDDDGVPERFWRYTVRSGDTLSGIAERSGISLSELLSYNGHVRTGVLRIGERLYLPGTEVGPPGVETDELPVWEGRYHVRPGDSLWSIARRFAVPPELLAEANHRRMDSVLAVGSVLKVPDRKEGES